jgi:hypothetical protein
MNASQRRAATGEDGFVGAGVETPCVSPFCAVFGFFQNFSTKRM